MKLELLAQLLQDEGFGTQGVDIFIHRMDADCKQGILLRLPLDGVKVDLNLPDYYKHHIQVIVRSPDQLIGDGMAARLQKTLMIYSRIFTNADGSLAMQLNQLYPDTLPRVYPRLDGQGVEWAIDFCANYVMPR